MAKFYFNGILLPEAPAEVSQIFTNYWIRDNTRTGHYELILGKGTWYYANSALYCSDSSGGLKWYRIEKTKIESATEWIFNQTWTSGNFFGAESDRPVVWTNHDVPRDSATSTDIYFYGTEPIPESGQESDEPESVIYAYTIDFTDPEWKTNRPDLFSVTDSETPFFVDSTLPYDGKQTLRSGAIGHIASSETTISFTLVEDGSVKLNYTVSSEKNSDRLYIYVDGATVVTESGEVPWTVYTKDLPAGNHTVKFRYTKDLGVSNGSDAGAIGYVTLTGIAKDYDTRYLIKSGDSLFTVSDGVLTALSENEVTADLFRTHGVDSIPSSDILTELEDPIVLYWVDTVEYYIEPLIAVEQAVPFEQVIKTQDYNMRHPSIIGIEKAIVDATDDVGFAVSFDEGDTWLIWSDSEWGELSEGDTGMSAETMNSIPTEDWNSVATTGIFRFRAVLPNADSAITSFVIDYLN